MLCGSFLLFGAFTGMAPIMKSFPALIRLSVKVLVVGTTDGGIMLDEVMPDGITLEGAGLLSIAGGDDDCPTTTQDDARGKRRCRGC